MLIEKLETLKRTLVEQRLIIAFQQKKRNWLLRMAYSPALADCTILEGQVIWLQCHASVIAGSIFMLRTLWGKTPIEKREKELSLIRLKKRSLCFNSEAKKLLEKRFLVDISHAAIQKTYISDLAPALKYLTGADFTKPTEQRNTIRFLIAEIYDLLDKVQANKLQSMDEIKDFVHLIGVKDSHHYRVLAGKLLIIGRDN